MKRVFRRICDYDARHWIFAAICFAAGVFAWLCFSDVSWPKCILSTWDSFAGCALAFSWLTIVVAENHHIRQEAQAQDWSRTLIFVFTVTIACVSLFTVIYFLSRANARDLSDLALSIFAIIAGWSLMHTVFAFRYAHIYYGASDRPNEHAGGLEFPNDNAPDYLDFAYFAFVIGMTCQVSDVEIASKALRRLALLQGVLSFGFNTVILALTFNGISGFLSRG